MAGRHEPSSSGSFYLSLSTAALRAMLVVGAIALGVFVLAKAFPTGAGSVPPVATDTTESPSPDTSPDDGDANGDTDEPPTAPDVSGLEIQVLNGTSVSGLAECTANVLEQREGFQDVIFGDAQGSSYPTSQIAYRPNAQEAAEYLQATYFEGAQLERAAQGTEVRLSVILGDEYAERPLRPCR